MIGQLIFAELPFACLGQPPYLEHGWIKDCAEQNDWVKKLTMQNPWSKMLENSATWEKQAANEVSTRGCDYTPSNIGER